MTIKYILISYFFNMNPIHKDKIMLDFYRNSKKVNYSGIWPYFIYLQEKWPVDFLSNGDAYGYLLYLRLYQ